MKNLRTQDEIIQNWKGDTDKPEVSICCITYNHEKYIEDALKGFLIQKTDFPFEILIHDDASTDRTAEIIREYEKKYPKIIKPIYQKENQYSKGIKIVNPTFNFPRAKGKYIAMCEGDDYWTDPKKLQIQKDFLDANPDYVICYTDSQPFDDHGLVDKNYGGATRDLSSIELQKATPIFTLTTMFRNVFEGKFPEELYIARYGDKCIWSVLGEYGKGKFLGNIEPSMYRVHDGGVHSKASNEKKVNMNLRTLFALYLYHYNKRNKSIKKYFAGELVFLFFRQAPAYTFYVLSKKIVLKILRLLKLK